MFNRRLLYDEYSLLAGTCIFVDEFSRTLILIKPAMENALGYRIVAFKFLNGKGDILVIWLTSG